MNRPKTDATNEDGGQNRLSCRLDAFASLGRPSFWGRISAIRVIASGLAARRPWQMFTACLGSAIGVFALVVTLSLSTGFSGEFISRVLDTTSHVTVRARDGVISSYDSLTARIGKIPGVAAAAPAIEGQALLDYRGFLAGVKVFGVDERAWKVISAGRGKVDGETSGGLYVGRRLAEELGASTGSRLSVTGPGPRMEMTICGTFSTGMYDYDTSIAYLGLEAAQELFELPPVATRIFVSLDSPGEAAAAARAIEVIGEGLLEAVPWTSLNSTLVAALRTEERVMAIFVSLILLVAAFAVGSLMTLLVSERREDIAVVRSMGFGRMDLAGIFLMAGAMLGTCGGAAGGFLGWLAVVALSQWPVEIPSEVYFISSLPAKIDPLTIFAVVAASALTMTIASAVPAWKASNIDPVNIFRGNY